MPTNPNTYGKAPVALVQHIRKKQLVYKQVKMSSAKVAEKTRKIRRRKAAQKKREFIQTPFSHLPIAVHYPKAFSSSLDTMWSPHSAQPSPILPETTNMLQTLHFPFECIGASPVWVGDHATMSVLTRVFDNNHIV